MAQERRGNKVEVRTRHLLQDFLDHVVRILIPHTVQDVRMQLLAEADLLLLVDALKRLLHDAAAVRAEREREHMALELAAQRAHLLA